MSPIVMEMSWSDSGTSRRWDVLSLILALMLHAPLYFMKFDSKGKRYDRPTQRLISVDLIEAMAPPKPVAPPSAPVVRESLVERLRALVSREPPPPPPPPPKPAEAPRTLQAPEPVRLDAQRQERERVEARLQGRSGFETTADPELVRQQQRALQAAPAGVAAPISERRLGVVEDRASLRDDRGSFQIARDEALADIGPGSGPAMAGPAAPVVAIRTGDTATREQFAAAPPPREGRGRMGEVETPDLAGERLGLRDAIIARDAAPTAIGAPAGRSGTGAAALETPASARRDAGRFDPEAASGVTAGAGRAAETAVARAPEPPPVVPVARPREKRPMFLITGPLSDREIVHQVLPVYPDWAQARGIEASVVLEFTVQPDGTVKRAVVVRRTSGYPRLDDSAISALREWRFAPLGADVFREEVGLITFNYSLN